MVMPRIINSPSSRIPSIPESGLENRSAILQKMWLMVLSCFASWRKLVMPGRSREDPDWESK